MQAAPARSCWRDLFNTLTAAAGLCPPQDDLRRRRVWQQPGLWGRACSAVPTSSHHISVPQASVLHGPLCSLVCITCSPALPTLPAPLALPPTAVCLLPLALRVPAGPILLLPGLDQVESHLQICAYPSPPAHWPPPRRLSSSRGGLGGAEQDEETDNMVLLPSFDLTAHRTCTRFVSQFAAEFCSMLQASSAALHACCL